MESSKVAPHKVLDVCPVCKHKFRANEKQLLTSYIADSNGKARGTEKKLLCQNCGVEFFPKEALKRLILKANALESGIILPG